MGLKGEVAQLAAWKRLLTLSLAPSLDATAPAIDMAAQLVGLNMNPARSIVTFTVFSRSGTPLRICGNGSLVTVTCEVTGLTLIAARSMTLPRLNGPATAGTTTDRPNGAPL